MEQINGKAGVSIDNKRVEVGALLLLVKRCEMPSSIYTTSQPSSDYGRPTGGM